MMTHAASTLVAGWVVLAALAGPVLSQEPVRPPEGALGPPGSVEFGPRLSGWTAEAIVGGDRYLSDAGIWKPWRRAELLVARQFTGGSIGIGAQQVERFDRGDGAFLVDVYRSLWRGAYGNIRGQVATEGVVLPTTDLSAELYQGLPRGWEPSIGVRRMGYTDPIFLTSLSMGKYVGDRWFGRVRGTRAETSDVAGGTSVSGLVRRYLGTPREFVEVAAGAGGEAVTAGLSAVDQLVVDIRQTTFVEVGGRKFVTDRFGGSASAGYHTFEAIPDRIGVRVGLIARF